VLNSAVGDFNFKNVIGKLGDVMYKFPFSLPPYYIAIIRCLGVLEGLAIQVGVSASLSRPDLQLRNSQISLFFCYHHQQFWSCSSLR
jgi:predicted unusual protein kinase regulating ubiquinone biosynthesis (AarF/ABC1/UbiB family)